MSLRIGSRGSSVETAQRALNSHGSHIDVDGRYGRRTAAAVREFQRDHHLHVDGVIGRETARALGLTDGFDAAPRSRSSERAGRTERADRPAESARSAETSRPREPEIDPRRGALLTPREMRELTVLDQLTIGADRMTRRLDDYHRHGEPVPSDELERARSLDRMSSTAIAAVPLGADPDGQLEGLAVAQGRLRAALARAEAER